MGMRVWHPMLYYPLHIRSWNSYQKHSFTSYGCFSSLYTSQYNNNNITILHLLLTIYLNIFYNIICFGYFVFLCFFVGVIYENYSLIKIKEMFSKIKKKNIICYQKKTVFGHLQNCPFYFKLCLKITITWIYQSLKHSNSLITTRIFSIWPNPTFNTNSPNESQDKKH